MRKIYVSFVSLILTLAMALSPAFAASYDTTKINSAINKVNSYYKKNNTLSSSDQVIAVEALGLDAGGKDFKLDPDYKKSLASLSTEDFGGFTKGIIALTLLGEDPSNYEKNNYVETLEGLVGSDGTIKDTTGPNQDVYALLALEAVNSSKVSIAAKHLASLALDSGAFWYYYKTKVADDSTTAWVIEALYNADAKAYDGTIKKAFSYLETGFNTKDGSYDTTGYGGNADTQACVLQAYFTADSKTALEKSPSPIDYLLKWQLTDGSFSALNYTTNKMESNDYTTLEAARCLGTYLNGSVYAKASANYKKLTDAKAAAEKAKKEAEEAKKAAEEKAKQAAEQAKKSVAEAAKKAAETAKSNTTSTIAATAAATKPATTAKTKTNTKTLKSKNVKLSKASYIYNAKTQKPTVKVTYNKKTLKKGKDYTVTYVKASKKVGVYTVKVKGKGNYKGTITKKYTIVPKKVTIKKVKAVKKGYSVTYKKSTGAKKYQVAYQNNKGKWVYKTTGKLSYTITAKKVKVVKVRAYVKTKAKTLYGAWSKKVSVKA